MPSAFEKSLRRSHHFQIGSAGGQEDRLSGSSNRVKQRKKIEITGCHLERGHQGVEKPDRVEMKRRRHEHDIFAPSDRGETLEILFAKREPSQLVDPGFLAGRNQKIWPDGLELYGLSTRPGGTANHLLRETDIALMVIADLSDNEDIRGEVDRADLHVGYSRLPPWQCSTSCALDRRKPKLS